MKPSIGILVILFAIGLAFAIQPVGNWTLGPSTQYVPNATANVTTSGGNVTSMNLSTNMSTSKWAGYWGNVSVATFSWRWAE